MAVSAVAKVHARWEQAAVPGLANHDAELVAYAADLLPPFLDMLGDRLPSDRAERFVAACERGPELRAARYRSGRPVTCVHGDAHFWNVLYPKDADSDHAVLIGREDWRLDPAGTDLALLVAMHWYPDRRARCDRDLLRHDLAESNHHAEVETSWDDHRLGHVCDAVVPVFQQAVGKAHASGWSHLERWFPVYDDLGCDEVMKA